MVRRTMWSSTDIEILYGARMGVVYEASVGDPSLATQDPAHQPQGGSSKQRPGNNTEVEIHLAIAAGSRCSMQG